MEVMDFVRPEKLDPVNLNMSTLKIRSESALVIVGEQFANFLHCN